MIDDARDLPPGFGAVRSAGGAWCGRDDCLAALREGGADFLLEEPGRPAPAAGEGRGRVTHFVLGGHAVIGKRSRRGGAVRALGGIFLGRRRGLDQIGAADRLRRAGVATPAILAVGFKAAGPIVYSQAVVVEEIEGALSLRAAGRGGPGARRALLEEVGEAVRRMHDAGFRHADLNVGNLLRGGPSAGRRIYVVDLEKGVFQDRLGVAARAGNLARLLRSYLKWMSDSEPLTAREEVRFLRAYARSERALLRDLQRRLQRHRTLWLRVRGCLRGHRRPVSPGRAH